MGLHSQAQCSRILQTHGNKAGKPDGLVITHRHSDHINYASLRTIEKNGIRIFGHNETIEDIGEKHYYSKNIKYKRFEKDEFKVGDIIFQPFEVDHQPGILTHGYVITNKQKGITKKIVIATDFFRFKGLISYFRNADINYIESNYDPDLLEKYPNYLSIYHMPNERTGRILAYSINQSSKIPKAIILGHLSEERNNPKLALKTAKNICKCEGIEEDLRLIVAPRYSATRAIKII